ncbi:hypothetical protein J6590_024103 [Homalodisca vitripennis]|nr:hypothetical protein J6590_024103 [Homalodisca vitripennis]
MKILARRGARSYPKYTAPSQTPRCAGRTLMKYRLTGGWILCYERVDECFQAKPNHVDAGLCRFGKLLKFNLQCQTLQHHLDLYTYTRFNEDSIVDVTSVARSGLGVDTALHEGRSGKYHLLDRSNSLGFLGVVLPTIPQCLPVCFQGHKVKAKPSSGQWSSSITESLRPNTKYRIYTWARIVRPNRDVTCCRVSDIIGASDRQTPPENHSSSVLERAINRGITATNPLNLLFANTWLCYHVLCERRIYRQRAATSALAIQHVTDY